MSSTPNKFTWHTALIFASMAVAFISCSAEPENRGRPQGPPPEAFEACADLSEEAACSFTGRRNDELSGTCTVLPNGKEELACAPEGGPPGERERPQ